MLIFMCLYVFVLRNMFRSSTEKCLQCFRQLLKLDTSQKVHESCFHYVTHQFYLTYFRNVAACWKGPQARKQGQVESSVAPALKPEPVI